MRDTQAQLLVKRFWWVAIVIGFVGIVVGISASRIFTPVQLHPDVKPPAVGSKESETGSTRMDPRLPQEELAGMNLRESKRHAEREVERYQKRPLEEKIAAQEMVVERKRAVLARMVRTNGIIYRDSDSPPKTPEETAKSRQITEAYVNAKREFEAEQAILQSMKRQIAVDIVDEGQPKEELSSGE